MGDGETRADERVATVNAFLTVGFSHAIAPIIVISAVATIIQQSFNIKGKTHGQESTVRDYQLGEEIPEEIRLHAQ